MNFNNTINILYQAINFFLKKHFIYTCILNLIYIVYLIKSLFNIDVNVEAFIHYFYTQINKILLISFEIF